MRLIVLDPFIYSAFNESEILILDCATGDSRLFVREINPQLFSLIIDRSIKIEGPWEESISELIQLGWALVLQAGLEPFIQNQRLVVQKEYSDSETLFYDDVIRYLNRLEIDILDPKENIHHVASIVKQIMSEIASTISLIVIQINCNYLLEIISDYLPTERVVLRLKLQDLTKLDKKLIQKFKVRLVVSEKELIDQNIDYDENLYEIEMQFESEKGLSKIIEKMTMSSIIIPTPVRNDNYVFLKDVLKYSPHLDLQRKLHPKNIIRNSIINQNNFGKIYFNNGFISPNNHDFVVKYSRENIYDMIRAQLLPKSHWRMVRMMFEPCKNCLYKELCPPIQSIEYQEGCNKLNTFCDMN